MARRSQHANEGLLVWLRAIAIGAATYLGMDALGFPWPVGKAAVAMLAALLSVISVEIGVGTAIIAVSLALTASNPVLGVLLMIVGLVSVRYIGNDSGQLFLLTAASIAGAVWGPAWVAVGLAGLLMGAADAAFAAAVACVTLELASIATGAAGGLDRGVVSFGVDPLVSTSNSAEGLGFSQWLGTAVANVSGEALDRVLAAIGGAPQPTAMLVQPLIWALAAVATALLLTRFRSAPVTLRAGLVAVGPLGAMLGTAAMRTALSIPIAWTDTAVVAVTSVLLTVGFSYIYLRFFPKQVAAATPATTTPNRGTSLAAEDADVDELLTLIATAEEKLASQHTTDRVVMITDMKSFSRMTEEDGSILTAKAIQKHRDLLLPVIEAHHGRGKSTGGDGLVAAFESAQDALTAAAQIQRALAAHNHENPSQREMSVRVGLAAGEVVLDRGGRPFIGSALNIAARIMNLADGGQVLMHADVAQSVPPGLEAMSHGRFELKNIAAPVEVHELLWRDGQQPLDPRSHKE